LRKSSDVTPPDPVSRDFTAAGPEKPESCRVKGSSDLCVDARLLAWQREGGIDVLTSAELLRRRDQ
jgi:hypothetical protein